jgi:hypothetical protein
MISAKFSRRLPRWIPERNFSIAGLKEEPWKTVQHCVSDWPGEQEILDSLHVWRPQRSTFGELVMMDSSPYRWLEDRRRRPLAGPLRTSD